MVKARIHPDLKDAFVKAAKAHGMSESDYLAALLADEVGLAHLAPSTGQEALPISA